MGFVYGLILAAIGFYIGNSAHLVLGWVLAIGGAYLGFKVATAGNKYRAELASKAAVEAEQLPSYKAAYLDLDIVGESYRQDALEGLWVNPEKTYNAVMIPESDNPHDRNAVRVEIDGIHVAYLSRETAEDYRSYMGDRRCKVPVHLVKGGPDGTIGVFTGKSKADKKKARAKPR